MISTSELKRGALLEIDNAPWLVLETTVHTPSARGASSITKAKIKNLKTGAVLTKSYRGGDMLQEADCEKRSVQFLYKDGDDYCFMDDESYDQFNLTQETIGDSSLYLLEGMQVVSMLYNGNVLNIELPNNVVLEITDTPPTLKGASAQAQLKPATLETGLVVQVPPYLSTGEKIKVDTRDGRYIERAK